MTDILCSPAFLRRFITGLFEAAGADRVVAEEVGRHLVNVNLSGHDSHGLLRIPQYFSQIEEGIILPQARPEMLQETAVTAFVDARCGLGQLSTWRIG